MFDVHIPFLTCLASRRFALAKEQVYVSGRTLVPREVFPTPRVPPEGAPTLSLSGCDGFKLPVLHGWCGFRPRVKYGMRLPGDTPVKASGPHCLEYSPDLPSFVLFRHKWTRRITNYRGFFLGGEATTKQNSTILGFE